MLDRVPLQALQALARFWRVACLAVCAPGGEVSCHRLTSFLMVNVPNDLFDLVRYVHRVASFLLVCLISNSFGTCGGCQGLNVNSGYSLTWRTTYSAGAWRYPDRNSHKH